MSAGLDGPGRVLGDRRGRMLSLLAAALGRAAVEPGERLSEVI